MKSWIILQVLFFLLGAAFAQQECGTQGNNGGVCADSGGFCCTQFEFCGTTALLCGTTSDYCKKFSGGGGDIGSLIPQSLFEEMLKHTNDDLSSARGFYTYDAFITAARSFNGFATTGNNNTRKREIAAFLAQTSHETAGAGWASNATDGPYDYGYLFVRELGAPIDYCVSSGQWPCAPGKKYYGRGPIQITYNYNYGQAGNTSQINYDLINDPDAVANDAIISFKTAFWFWMTPRSPPEPSCHDVITGQWTPSTADRAAGRLPGYGTITNIINGGIECGQGANSMVKDRIGFYKRYCDLLGVTYGDNLDCYDQKPFI